MKEHFDIRNLKANEVTEMYLTFLDAFSDYPVPFRLSKEQFVRKFVHKLNIDFPLSCGAFDYSGALIAFIFTSINYYQGRKTAYNGGTGVRPSYRGNKLVQKMYDILIPKLKEAGISQSVLEVLVQNERAIKIYEKVGFKQSQLLKCFKLNSEVLTPTDKLKVRLEIFNVNSPNFQTYDRFNSYTPSFLDSSKMLLHNLANETVVEARHEGNCVGYAIFQPSTGRISQIGVDASTRQMGIGSALIKYVYETSTQKALTILNVSDQARETLSFFERLGFVNELDQYEMTLNLE